jgi:TolB-like protein
VGRANIDPVSREATFDSQSERLQPQNLKVLVALARHRSKVVTRDLLVDLCWDGRIVGDDVINRAVSNLRQFAERAGGFSIETVPRAGYRLVEPLPPGRSRLWLIGAVAAITLAIAGTAFVQWPRHDDDRQMPTIAILPFTAASGDAQERELAADARDAIAQSLSATEYQVRLSDGSPRARHTADDFVVSGDVSANPQKMVVTVRVEDTVHDAIVYSNRFETERGEAGNLPDQVGAQIAGSLGWAASLLRLDRTHPSDPAITAELFRQSADYQTARQIAAKAPNSVIAQIVLAYTATDVLPDLPFDQRAEAAAAGRRALDRARLLAPRFGDTETMWCLLHSHARFIECEDHLRAVCAAIRLRPHFRPGLQTN